MNFDPNNHEAPFGNNHGPHIIDNFAPIAEEQVLDNLSLEGKIPVDLSGVYLRNGPNPRFKPKGAHHYFDGEGMLHSAQFKDGKVIYRNKWVRTDGWKKNDETGSENHWGVMSTLKDSSEKPMNDVSNTDVIGHAGKAVTSWYLAGIPYIINPLTLDTERAAPEYVSGPGKGMSAHCKVDEVTGDLLYFDYFTEKPHMSYGVVSAEGKLVHHVPIELPGDRLMHDMGVTEHYSILHDVPVYHDEDALKSGRHKIRFDSSLPIRFGVIPRFGASDSIRWFEFSSCFLYHVVNSWEEGDEVVMIACRYMPARNEDGSIDETRTARMIATLKMDARLWSYRMNMKTGETSEKCLNPDFNVEFPCCDSAKTGRLTNWAYLVDHDPIMLRWTGLRKMNTITGESVGEWSDGADDCWYSEPCFAPKDNAQAEDDGYVVMFCWNDKTKAQQIQIFDALDINKGPVARVNLPNRLPPGFHACWMKPSQIAYQM
jgi:carotenoid cleavage dioxygenase